MRTIEPYDEKLVGVENLDIARGNFLRNFETSPPFSY